MATYISNAFSIGMLSSNDSIVRIKNLELEKVKEILSRGFISAVGHKATADVITQMVGIDIPTNRVEIKLTTSDKLVVFQILTRLPEGVILSKEEVDKIPHKWYLVELLPPDETIEALYHW